MFEIRVLEWCQNLHGLCEWAPEVGEEVVTGAKNIKQWWGPEVGWITHLSVEVKNDGRGGLGKESEEPGAGGQEVRGDSSLGYEE